MIDAEPEWDGDCDTILLSVDTGDSVGSAVAVIESDGDNVSLNVGEAVDEDDAV